MPPRHAFWTILVDDQPTAFRAHDADELLAVLNRLKEKHPSAVMKWFERGRLWESREAARREGHGRGERRWEGPRPDPATARPAERRAPPAGEGEKRRDRSWRPGGEHRDPRQKYKDAKKAKWQRFKQKIRGASSRPPGAAERPGPRGPKPAPGAKRDRPAWGDRGGWKGRERDGRERDARERDGRERDGKWSQGAEPSGGRPHGGQPFGRKPSGGRPHGAKPFGSKPSGGRPFGSRPHGARPFGGTPPGGRPRGAKPDGRPSGRAKPWRPAPGHSRGHELGERRRKRDEDE